MLTKCGCNKHFINISSQTVVFWKENYWDYKCAFVISNNETSKLINELMVLRKSVEKLKCYLCDKPVGRSYQFWGCDVFHKECANDLGGEG